MAQHFGLGHVVKQREDAAKAEKEEGFFKEAAVMLLGVAGTIYTRVERLIAKRDEQPRL